MDNNKNTKNHKILSFAIIVLSVVFGFFLLAVSLGHLEQFRISMTHFSPIFFLITLIFTVMMSYKIAKRYRGKHYKGPFLTSILLGIFTQFINFILSPYIDWNNTFDITDLVKKTIFFILPSLLAFIIIRLLLVNREIISNEDNSWFNWEFYLRWVGMMSNAMTVTIFLSLFISTGFEISILGIRGTIWAFYSVVADFLSRYFIKEVDLVENEEI